MRTQAEFRMTQVTENHVQAVKQRIDDNPSWSRSRLSIELCQLWNWHSPVGQMKDMACRDLLLKLERRGQIVLPSRSVSAKRGENMKSLVYDRHERPPASHLLGKICRRIRGEWQEKCGHGLLLLETFWRYVGLTKGRSRNDRCHKLEIPVKAVYLYPLVKHLPGGDLQ